MTQPMWQPSASIANLRKRAEILTAIRAFFHQADVLEVETPSLSQASVTDVHLASFATQFVGPGFANGVPLYLQTSPEYAMKRLLAAGSGAIFQISKAFRNEESGRHHNPEFTMLEWYRPGFDHFQLMDEIDRLMQHILVCLPAEKFTYQEVFELHLGVDPLVASLEELKAVCSKHGFANISETETDKDTLLQLLFCTQVEPNIGQKAPCFVYDFPASQASLANICSSDSRVAERFELYYQNMELANGFNELTDAAEQAHRFKQDNLKRQSMGLPSVSIDSHLISALEHGLEPCSGVALGIDRLIMLALGCDSIKQVISFDIERA
ncbi:elongation factor P--(R)-beta-lysine ligase [Shewanella atlantica]|uniref:Elongation factor P--(R)-beta-lysine ligase n=1 Tax=Shewanella atlantica TaxID=271099 RepID=A0A431WH58_9GAMM|nr:elongation factor P--(R)-beta-lysine ligase [Shewanella atlantica]RTR34822.1 elongation factor P--(R)-beta-lysine ligase [Shewanella atlantica]